MKRMIKYLLSAVLALGFSACMFYCLVAGAPKGEGLALYVVSAAGFSLLTPAFVGGCIHYILHLQKKIRELERDIPGDRQEP